MENLFEKFLFSIGPIYACFGATFGYKTYRKFEFIANLIFATVLIAWPDPIIKLMVNNFSSEVINVYQLNHLIKFLS